MGVGTLFNINMVIRHKLHVDKVKELCKKINQVFCVIIDKAKIQGYSRSYNVKITLFYTGKTPFL